MKRILSSPHFSGISVGVLAMGVYLSTLAPSVNFIDSGELAAVACTLGIAHPTGYPLFTLLGWIFSRLPIGSEEIVRLNLMAAIFCAVGVVLFFHVVRLLLTIVFDRKGVSKHGKTVPAHAANVASAGAALLLAFSETYWSQATSIEVYSLHVMLLSAGLFCFVRATFLNRDREEASSTVREDAWWFLFAFVLGISFTNHMTTILLAPGLIYLYFAMQGIQRASWKRIARMVIPFLLGLSVYLYLPFRAAQSPILNWGNPATMERFLWHFTGKQYRVWIFSSTEAAGRQLTYFMNSLPSEFAYIGLLFAIIGVWVLWRIHKRLFVTLALLFLTCVFYSINYDIHDIDSYFLLAYIAVALFAGFGLYQSYTFMFARWKVREGLIAAVVVVASLAPAFLHFDVSDESDNYLVEDYTHNMFASLEQSAVVFSFQWDYWVSASYYYQFVRNARPDVVVVDKELLRRSWYFKQLENLHPWLIAESRGEVDAFLVELNKFERSLPYDPAVIQARFVGMINSLVKRNMASRPVYVTPEIEPEFTQGLMRAPEGLAFRVLADTAFHQSKLTEMRYRPLHRKGRLEDMTKQLYVSALLARSRYYYSYGRTDEAVEAARTALQFDPTSIEALRSLTALQQTQPK